MINDENRRLHSRPPPVLNLPLLEQPVTPVRFGREVLWHHADLQGHIRLTLVADDIEVRMDGIESSVFDGGYCPASVAMPVQVAAHNVQIEPDRQSLQLLRGHDKIFLLV